LGSLVTSGFPWHLVLAIINCSVKSYSIPLPRNAFSRYGCKLPVTDGVHQLGDDSDQYLHVHQYCQFVDGANQLILGSIRMPPTIATASTRCGHTQT